VPTNVIDITAGGNTTIPFDTFFTATIKNFKKGLEKNFLDYRPVVSVMMDNYKKTDTAGGRIYQTSAAYGYNSTTKWFQGAETFDQTPAQTALPLIYQWFYLGSAVSTTRTEQVENRGKVALFNILQSRIDQAMRTMTTDLGTALYGDGSGFNNLAPVGLAGMISTTPTVDLTPRPVGGLSATNVWWRNNAVTSFGSFAANGVKGTSQDLVYSTMNLCTDGAVKRPKVILSAQDVAGYYNQTNLGIVRYIDVPGQKADLTFQGENGSSGQFIRGLYYEGIPWIWDRQCPSGRMYMFDPEDFFVTTDPSMFFEWTDNLQYPYQLAWGKIVSLRLSVCAVARMFGAVLDGITA